MKTLLILVALVFSSAIASAQAVDPFVQAAVDAAMPQQYAGYTSLALIALMWLGRAIPVLQQGSGIIGWFKAILFGTNGPHLLIVCLAVMSLSSCAATTAFLASPFGQVVEASAVSLGKQLAKEVELQGIAAIIDKANAQLAAIKANPAPTTTLAVIEIGGEVSMLKAVIAAAQSRYKERAGHFYEPDKNPVASVNPSR